jgi:DNA-binding NtrC family response regulator
VVIRLPPLRQRAEDIPELAKYFVRRFTKELKLGASSIQPDAMEWLKQRPWPGNVRELENVLRQAVLASRGFAITQEILELVATLPEPAAQPQAERTLDHLMDELLEKVRTDPELDVHAKVMEAMEARLFSRAYDLARGNQALASRWLKVSRQTMREKLQKFGVRERPDADGSGGSEQG